MTGIGPCNWKCLLMYSFLIATGGINGKERFGFGLWVQLNLTNDHDKTKTKIKYLKFIITR